ncbi:MAG: MAPEG family protein [Rhodanobacteraceae bacterium]|nr:MAPEG family protein [Rhodanobacteraceae bacterium]
MAIELQYVGWTLILALVQIFLPAIGKFRAYGMNWSTSSRDAVLPPPSLPTQRLERAHRNLMETLPIFVAIVLVGAISGRLSPRTAMWVQIYFWARVVYVPAYALGIPYLRSAIWGVSFTAIVALLIRILFA